MEEMTEVLNNIHYIIQKRKEILTKTNCEDWQEFNRKSQYQLKPFHLVIQNVNELQIDLNVNQTNPQIDCLMQFLTAFLKVKHNGKHVGISARFDNDLKMNHQN